jgi:hypothetical protein
MLELKAAAKLFGIDITTSLSTTSSFEVDLDFLAFFGLFFPIL